MLNPKHGVRAFLDVFGSRDQATPSSLAELSFVAFAGMQMVKKRMHRPASMAVSIPTGRRIDAPSSPDRRSSGLGLGIGLCPGPAVASSRSDFPRPLCS
uniref:hypothetical protein n=1 Tax=Rhizobium sp. F40D2 TaxID=3453141 RepID=UPI003F21D47F